MKGESGDLRSLLLQWQVGLRERQITYWRISANYERCAKWLDGGASLLAALVGTGIIAGLAEGDDPWGRAVFAFLSLASALSAALQTFFDYPTRSSMHGAAAAELAACEGMRA
jgi:hypothetical protein